jgi:hypothetical protein
VGGPEDGWVDESAADGVLRKDKTQQPFLACFVIQPGLCLHAKRATQAVLVEVQRLPAGTIFLPSREALEPIKSKLPGSVDNTLWPL